MWQGDGLIVGTLSLLVVFGAMPPQFPVVKYHLLVGTAPQGGAAEFLPGVLVDIQTSQGVQQIRLPINGPTEFMAVCALLQTPGTLSFDQQLMTLAKVGP